MKTTTQLTNQTLETLGLLPILQKSENALQPKLPAQPQIAHPCRTKWQQKWLGMDVTAPAIQVMADETEAFADRWFKRNPRPGLLVLVGPNGVGKTTICSCLSRFARQAASSAWDNGFWPTPPSCVYVRWPEVCNGFKNSQYGVIDDAIEANLLCLDDIGAENDPSTNGRDKLCQILSRRENQFTIVTTNIDPSAWPDRFDLRIADRLMRNSKVVNLFGCDSYALGPGLMLPGGGQPPPGAPGCRP